jgi:hypothetical protein
MEGGLSNGGPGVILRPFRKRPERFHSGFVRIREAGILKRGPRTLQRKNTAEIGNVAHHGVGMQSAVVVEDQ